MNYTTILVLGHENIGRLLIDYASKMTGHHTFFIHSEDYYSKYGKANYRLNVEKLLDTNNNFIVLTDIRGGIPFQIIEELKMVHPDKIIYHITNMNPALLIELINNTIIDEDELRLAVNVAGLSIVEEDRNVLSS